jgi:hypothetical protein
MDSMHVNDMRYQGKILNVKPMKKGRKEYESDKRE